MPDCIGLRIYRQRCTILEKNLNKNQHRKPPARFLPRGVTYLKISDWKVHDVKPGVLKSGEFSTKIYT